MYVDAQLWTILEEKKSFRPIKIFEKIPILPHPRLYRNLGVIPG